MTEQEYKEQHEKCEKYSKHKQTIRMYKDIIIDLNASETPKEICNRFIQNSCIPIVSRFLSEAKEQLISRLQDKIKETEKYLEEI